MRLRVLGSLAAAAMTAGLAMSVAPSTSALATTVTPVYYLALGDSLSQGVQPDSTGANQVTNNGYVDDLYNLLKVHHPALQLAKLGCPGETTTTFINGGICSYPEGNQLAAAEAFIATHKVIFITIDIGANNVDGCISNGTVDQQCLVAGITAMINELPVILTGIHNAAPTVRIHAMNYYDPFVAAWLTGPAGQVLAQQTVALGNIFNHDMDQIYYAFNARVVDVAGTFQTRNFTIDPSTGLPLNVELICAWTYMCAPAPVGPNIHATTPGYAAIAGSFAATYAELRP